MHAGSIPIKTDFSINKIKINKGNFNKHVRKGDNKKINKFQ